MSSADTDAPIALLDRRIQQDDGLTGGHVNYKLYNVRVFVTDWRRAIRFYTATLDMAVAHRNDDIGWAQMATGEGQLSLERVDVSDDEGRALSGALLVSRLKSPTSLRRTSSSPRVVSSSSLPRRSSPGVAS